ncbi:MAG TPA: hypothetical protein VF678_15405 [bacterium]
MATTPEERFVRAVERLADIVERLDRRMERAERKPASLPVRPNIAAHDASLRQRMPPRRSAGRSSQ